MHTPFLVRQTRLCRLVRKLVDERVVGNQRLSRTAPIRRTLNVTAPKRVELYDFLYHTNALSAVPDGAPSLLQIFCSDPRGRLSDHTIRFFGPGTKKGTDPCRSLYR